MQRKLGNFVRQLGDIDDDSTAAMVKQELDMLGQQRMALDLDRETLIAERASWQYAQDRLDDIELWVSRWNTNLDDLDYDGKRDLLFALSVVVKVRATSDDTGPRF